MKHPFEYQKPTEVQIRQIARIREACKDLHTLLNQELPNSRERSVALTKLQEVSMWANLAVVMQEDK